MQDRTKSNKKLIWVSIGIFAVVIISFLIYHSFMHGLTTTSLSVVPLSKKGLYGDSFGALTPLFTGLAFAGLIVTILLQQKELKAQHKEFVDMNANHKHMLKLTASTQLVMIYQDRIDRNYKKYEEHLKKIGMNDSFNDPYDSENTFLMKSRDKILDSLEALAEVPLTSNRIKKSN